MSFEEIKNHHIIGAKQAREILNQTILPEYKIEKIVNAILFHCRSIDDIK